MKSLAVLASAPGATYAPACDADYDGDVDIFDIQLDQLSCCLAALEQALRRSRQPVAQAGTQRLYTYSAYRLTERRTVLRHHLDLIWQTHHVRQG